MFGRATIRLGIGPHSNFIFITLNVRYDLICFENAVRSQPTNRLKNGHQSPITFLAVGNFLLLG